MSRPKAVVTLGTFDGVHRGHLALLKKVVQRARAIGAEPVALAFGMPPRHAGEPLSQPVLLTTLSEKLEIFKRRGIAKVHVLVFDRKTASTPPDDFFRNTILKKLHAREMVVGPKVAFGKNRAGRLPLLRRLGATHGVRIHVVSSIRGVSSRRIRFLLNKGQVEKANKLLGYPYAVEGEVIHGSHRGRKLGFPTANIQVDPGKILPRGVFWVKVNGQDGLCNVGTRPTFTPNAHALHCEVFLLKGKGSLYGKKLKVEFWRRIRAEKRFSSPHDLTRQITRDLKTAYLYKKSHFSI